MSKRPAARSGALMSHFVNPIFRTVSVSGLVHPGNARAPEFAAMTDDGHQDFFTLTSLARLARRFHKSGIYSVGGSSLFARRFVRVR
jgi:hypothetical protein